MFFELLAMSATMGDVDWKKVLIVTTVGAFVIACVIAMRQMVRKYVDMEDTSKSKKRGKK